MIGIGSKGLNRFDVAAQFVHCPAVHCGCDVTRGLSQLSLTDRFLLFWERLSGFVNFFNSEDHRKHIVLFADAPLTVKAEALLEPQHGFKTGDGFSG